MVKNETVVGHLNYSVRTYEAVTKVMASMLQRLQSLPGDQPTKDFDTVIKGEEGAEGIQTVKGRFLRAIEKELRNWDIWNLWLKNIPGIGPAIAGRLVIYYYYRFVPTCQDCGGDLEKISKDENSDEKNGKMICKVCHKKWEEGLLKYRMEIKDFPNISKWWKYMGRHTVDGVMPKRKKGVVSDWGTPKRTLGFHIGEQFNRQDESHPYKQFLIERKRKHERDNPKWTRGHIHNAAKNEAVKLFLAHFWTVARTIDGLPLTEPYAGTILGHTNIIKPFFWNREINIKPKPQDASENRSETHSRFASDGFPETRMRRASEQPGETQRTLTKSKRQKKNKEAHI